MEKMVIFITFTVNNVGSNLLSSVPRHSLRRQKEGPREDRTLLTRGKGTTFCDRNSERLCGMCEYKRTTVTV